MPIPGKMLVFILHEKQGCFVVQAAFASYAWTSDYEAAWTSNSVFSWSVAENHFQRSSNSVFSWTVAKRNLQPSFSQVSIPCQLYFLHGSR